MLSIRSLTLLALPCLAACSATNPTRRDSDPQHDFTTLKQRVQKLPAESLETALHHALAPKYQHGIFEDAAGALEIVHGHDPELATKVVEVATHEAAVQRLVADLRRRQSDNTTLSSSSTSTSVPVTTASTMVTDTIVPGTSTSAPATSQDSPPPSSSQTGVLIPITISSTNGAGQTVVQTTAVFQPSDTVSVAQTVVTTNAQGQTTTQIATVPGAVGTGTNSAGQAVTTTAPAKPVTVADNGSIINSGSTIVTTTDSAGNMITFAASSSGQVITATAAGGGVAVVTYHPPDQTVSKLVVKTSRLPNGQLVTVTSLAVVGAPTASSNGDSSSPSGSNSGSNPQLVSDGAAAPTGRFSNDMAALVGGVLGLAAML